MALLDSNSHARRDGLATAGWLIVLLWGAAQGRPFLIPICVAALFAFMIAPLVKALRRKRVPEWAALTLAALGLLLPFALVIYEMVVQGQKLVHDFPALLASLQRMVGHLADSAWAQKLHISRDALDLQSLTAKLGSGAGKGVAILVGGLAVAVDASSITVLVLIFALLMVASRDHLRRASERILARARGIDGPAILNEVTAMVERFLLARLLIVAIIGAADSIALSAFGIDYSILLGALAGVLTLVPNIGFFAALIPILIVAIAGDHSTGAILAMTGTLVVISFIEGNVLSPKLIGRTLNVNTLACFIGFFAGGLLWGVWGMFLSVPLLGVMRIIFSAVPGLEAWGGLLAEKTAGEEAPATKAPELARGGRVA